MKFFIDTANLEQIREANALGVLDGVTTNPSLMAKEGIKGVENQHKHYIEICNIVDGDVSAEVIATDYEEMIREGEELAALNPHIVVKVPCIENGIKAIKYFSNKGIRTNCTLVFSAGQALLAAKAGATYVRLWADWMTFVATVWGWLPRLSIYIRRMITQHRSWPLPSATLCTYCNVLKWAQM